MMQPRALRFLSVYLPLYFASGLLSTSTNANSDTRLHYLLVLGFAIAALVATIAWPRLGHEPTDDDRLSEYLRTFLRYAVAWTLIGFGVFKVIPVLFPPLRVEHLLPSLGASSPMGLLSRFMGYSYGYSAFVACGEFLAGALLLFRRTTVMGALVALAVLGNAVMLNLSYDVPTKLLSLHLLLATVVLLWPHVQRLIDLLVFQRAVEAEPVRASIFAGWSPIARVSLKTLIIGAAVALPLMHASRIDAERRAAERLPLNGVYVVETFVRNGDTLPPLATDSARWRILVVQAGLTVQFMDDSIRRYTRLTDTLARTLTVGSTSAALSRSGATGSVLMYGVPDPQHLTLTGPLDGDSLRVTLRRADARAVFGSRGLFLTSDYARRQFLESRPHAILAPQALDRYVGEYRFADTRTTITRDGVALFRQDSGRPKVRLVAGTETQFFMDQNVNAHIIFQRDSAGTVTGLMLTNPSGNYRGAKVK